MQYPATFTPEEGKFLVQFRDIPEATTQGDDEADAMEMAKDALISSMDFYLEKKRAVPLPSRALPGDRLVAIPASAAAKVLLLNEMLAQEIGPSELGRRLGISPQGASRLVDLEHATKIDQIEGALLALGRRLELSIGSW